MSLLKRIEYVMDHFDFKRVENVMDLLEWKWADLDRVPTLPEIRAAARKLMHEAVALYEEEGSPVNGMDLETGGFQVSIFHYTCGNMGLRLTFLIASCTDSTD